MSKYGIQVTNDAEVTITDCVLYDPDEDMTEEEFDRRWDRGRDVEEPE